MNDARSAPSTRRPGRLLIAAVAAGLVALGLRRALTRFRTDEALSRAEWVADGVGPDDLAG
ncbi:hypothetical protein [Rhodococcus tukisamuensis]|uniref:Uncharacterized protein n=1 Tax=Rhodococcus tukisamuensis TaxID=168276 RepID=A0A1G7DI55_9NOCA|nr:hypothetical protein [Rhodococcus tukisamuensis]SDE51163.1 hypothetical protein SAMN05444580_11960 [Rhodococcus tukisamuensis]